MHVTSQNGVAWLVLRGELDMSAVEVLRGHPAPHENEDVSSVVLDLRDLAFLDSSGLHAIGSAWRRAETNGQQFRVVGAGTTARRVFEIAGMEFVLDDGEVVSTLGRFTNGHRSPSA